MIRPSRRVAAPVPGLLLDGISQMRNGRCARTVCVFIGAFGFSRATPHPGLVLSAAGPGSACPPPRLPVPGPCPGRSGPSRCDPPPLVRDTRVDRRVRLRLRGPVFVLSLPRRARRSACASGAGGTSDDDDDVLIPQFPHGRSGSTLYEGESSRVCVLKLLFAGKCRELATRQAVFLFLSGKCRQGMCECRDMLTMLTSSVMARLQFSFRREMPRAPHKTLHRAQLQARHNHFTQPNEPLHSPHHPRTRTPQSTSPPSPTVGNTGGEWDHPLIRGWPRRPTCSTGSASH